MAYTAFSVVFGEQPTAAKWNTLGANDASFNDGTGIDNGKILPNHLFSGASTLNTWVWDSWTPVWTSSGSAPAIGNGTLTGSTLKVGKTCFFRIKFVGGTTTTWGTGTYYITVPFAGYSGIAANDGFSLGGYAEDSGVKGYTVANARMLDTNKFMVQMIDTAAASTVVWGQTSPFTWGTNDYWSANGFYQVV